MRIALRPIYQAALLAGACLSMNQVYAGTISFTGNLRTNATFVDCGPGCTLGAGNSDGDYAQYAAVVETFNVPVASTMSAITFSYGGGKNGQGTVIAQSGFEPYLSLFDGAGDFLASTLFGTTCPAGANTNSTTGLCYDVGLDGGVTGVWIVQCCDICFRKYVAGRESWRISFGGWVPRDSAIWRRARTCTLPSTWCSHRR